MANLSAERPSPQRHSVYVFKCHISFHEPKLRSPFQHSQNQHQTLRSIHKPSGIDFQLRATRPEDQVAGDRYVGVCPVGVDFSLDLHEGFVDAVGGVFARDWATVVCEDDVEVGVGDCEVEGGVGDGHCERTGCGVC